MNQDHLSQQPAADAYVIGGPSDFAEDQSPPGKGWKAEQGSDGNTKRDEIGLPEYRSDTFNNPEKSPGVSPSRQASLAEVHAKAEVATRVARLMLPKTASEQVIEDQALTLMDLPLSNLRTTLTRLAEEQDSDEEDDDDGQSKEASQDDDEDDSDEGQAKQAKDLPPEFLKNIQKKKDEAKDKDDDKGQSKEARRRLKAQQQDDESDEGQAKQARSRKAQQDDDDDKGQSKEARRRLKAQEQDSDDDEGQSKQARSRKAQQDDADDDDDKGQSKQARSRKAQDEKDGEEEEGEKKQAQAQGDDEKKEAQGDEEKQVGKEAYTLIKQAAAGLLELPVASRPAAFKIALPGLVKAANQQLGPTATQEQVQAQVQQLVQNAMQQLQGQQQQQVAQGQQQPLAQGQQALADDALVDQMLQDQGDFTEQSIQLDAPDMDLGLSGEDPALQQIFASSNEVQLALEARALQSGHPAPARTASTRTVGTRPSAGVSVLGGGTSGGGASNSEDINRLSSMWASAPDVSNVFRS